MTHEANAYAATIKPGEPSCPRCDDTGIVEVRHPEFDFASMDGEAWLSEWCDCLAGQMALDEYMARVEDEG